MTIPISRPPNGPLEIGEPRIRSSSGSKNSSA
jgi:hypothetical protein